MKMIIQYQVEVAICMAVFAILYALQWRKETNFHFKRFLLLGVPLLSIIIPLININIDLKTEQVASPIQYITYLPNQLDMVYSPIVSNASTIGIWEIAFWMLALGIAIMFLRLLISLCRIIQVYRQSIPDPTGKFRIVDKTIQSFSFFHMIIINKSQAESNERDYIVAHENAHKRQGHSWDIVCLEIIKILHWFNPLIWLFTQESKKNLEYLADRDVVMNTRDIRNYQLAIVQHASPTDYRLLKTQFSKTNLKNRIIMMNQSNKRHLASWKFILIAPVLSLLFASFSLKINDQDISRQLMQAIPEIESSTEKLSTIIGARSSDDNAEQSNLLADATGEQVPSRKPAESAMLDFLENRNQKIKTERDSGEVSDGKAFRIHPVNTELFEMNAYNSTVLSGNANPVNLPPRQIVFNKKARVVLSMSLSGIEHISGTITDASGDPIPGANILIKGSTTGTVTDLTGKFLLKCEPRHEQIVVSMVGYKIKTLDIIPDKDYEIVLERDPETLQQQEIKVGRPIYLKSGKETADPDKMPLYILDGKEIESLNTINPNEIASISVLKDSSAVGVYGERGRYGVIIIRSKDASQHDDSFIINELGDEVENSIQFDISKSFDKDNPPLILLDGKEISHKKLKKLKPETIASIEILKGESAIKKYEEKGKNGVIIIKLKD